MCCSFWNEIVFIEIVPSEVWFSVRINRWLYFKIILQSINPLNGICPSALRADLRFRVSAGPTGHFISSVKRFVNRTVCCSRCSICWAFLSSLLLHVNNTLCWRLLCHKTVILARSVSINHQSIFICTASIHKSSHDTWVGPNHTSWLIYSKRPNTEQNQNQSASTGWCSMQYIFN